MRPIVYNGKVYTTNDVAMNSNIRREYERDPTAPNDSYHAYYAVYPNERPADYKPYQPNVVESQPVAPTANQNMLSDLIQQNNQIQSYQPQQFQGVSQAGYQPQGQQMGFQPPPFMGYQQPRFMGFQQPQFMGFNSPWMNQAGSYSGRGGSFMGGQQFTPYGRLQNNSYRPGMFSGMVAPRGAAPNHERLFGAMLNSVTGRGK